MNNHKRTIILVLSVILAVCGGGTILGQDFDWPCWRGPEGNGISKEANWNPMALTGGPKILWQANVGLGYASVAIQGNRLITTGMVDGNFTVFCLEADSGKSIWRYTFEDYEETLASPVIDTDSVYALSKKGILVRLRARNGRLRWKKDLVADYGAVRPHYGFSGSPVVVGKYLILTANTAGMALNKNSGALVWSSEPPPAKIKAYDPLESNGADYATPVIYQQDGQLYALVCSWKGISSVETETGRPNWVYEWELYSGRHVTDPVVSGNSIYIADNFGASASSPPSLLLEVTRQGPKVLWKSTDLVTEISTAITIDGHIYGGQGGPYRYKASLRCISLATGKLMWDQKLSEAVISKCVSLMAAGGKLIVLTDDGVLCIAEASAEGYKEISRCTVLPEAEFVRFWTPPVLCNGRIYCRNYSGELVCIDISK